MKLLLFGLTFLFSLPLVARFVVWAVDVGFHFYQHFPLVFVFVLCCLGFATVLVDD